VKIDQTEDLRIRRDKPPTNESQVLVWKYNNRASTRYCLVQLNVVWPILSIERNTGEGCGC